MHGPCCHLQVAFGLLRGAEVDDHGAGADVQALLCHRGRHEVLEAAAPKVPQDLLLHLAGRARAVGHTHATVRRFRNTSPCTPAASCKPSTPRIAQPSSSAHTPPIMQHRKAVAVHSHRQSCTRRVPPPRLRFPTCSTAVIVVTLFWGRLNRRPVGRKSREGQRESSRARDTARSLSDTNVMPAHELTPNSEPSIRGL